MSSSMASIYDILSTIRSFFRTSGQLPSFVADRPSEDVKSILHVAAERHSHASVIAYPNDHAADMVSGRRLPYGPTPMSKNGMDMVAHTSPMAPWLALTNMV